MTVRYAAERDIPRIGELLCQVCNVHASGRPDLFVADAKYNVQGAVLAGASNDASGNFTFDSITCSESGTFYYVVTEDDSAGVEGMTYDDTAYGIKVNVLDDGTGSLKASYTITMVGGDTVEAIVF